MTINLGERVKQRTEEKQAKSVAEKANAEKKAERKAAALLAKNLESKRRWAIKEAELKKIVNDPQFQEALQLFFDKYNRIEKISVTTKSKNTGLARIIKGETSESANLIDNTLEHALTVTSSLLNEQIVITIPFNKIRTIGHSTVEYLFKIYIGFDKSGQKIRISTKFEDMQRHPLKDAKNFKKHYKELKDGSFKKFLEYIVELVA